MNRSFTFTSAVIVAALSVAVAPAVAQNPRGGGHQGGGGGHATASRPQSAPRAPQGRTSSAPPGAQGRSSPAPQGHTYAAPRELPRTSSPRTYAPSQAIPRNNGNGSTRGGAQAVPRPYGMEGNRYGMSRGYATPGHRGYAGYMSPIRPYFSRAYVRPYGWRPYYPFHFVRPYYVFSPWLSLGFGLWCGYPVPYPWVYLGDYQPTVFGDYPDNDVQAVPGSPASVDANTYGGVSFDIQPSDANLFVDGQYVGVVASFGPLTLEPGQHRIAIQRDGYRPLEWDVTIEAGQVIPYKGALDRQ